MEAKIEVERKENWIEKISFVNIMWEQSNSWICLVW